MISRPLLRTVAAVPVLLAALLPAGCGEDPIQAYCDHVEQHRAEIADMVSSDAGPGALITHLPMLRDLEQHAPPDLRADWQTFVNAVTNLDDALRSAHLKPSEFKGGVPPATTPAAAADSVRQAASQLEDPQVFDASRNIEQEARDVCKVNFGL